MKKNTLVLLLFFLSLGMYAQEEIEYNKWSVDLGAGLNKATRPMTPGFYSGTFAFDNTSFNLGVRHMFNDKFGLKLGAGYHSMIEGDNSLPFETEMYNVSLEAVVNLGTIFGFREGSADWFNLLGHAGYGMGFMSFDDDAPSLEGDDSMDMIMVGLTPQVRLSDRFSLHADLTMAGTLNHDINWDGRGVPGEPSNRGFNGLFSTVSVGLSVYLGGNDQHADFVNASNAKQLEDELDMVEKRLARVEEDLQDDDRDGVPNYLDEEPNTPAGVRTDPKGRALDTNDNGIPDDLEESLDKRFVTEEKAKEKGMIMSGDGEGGAGSTMAKNLLNDGYVNVYFRFDSTQPETYSFDAINYAVRYMKSNPEASAELIGYADQIGNSEYNDQLSERRAKKVYDILIASGISEDRLEFRGGGVDDSVDKESREARNIVRRVTFQVK
ncbi:MAG: OmpA family protein [Bacteroidota bacterium]